MQLSLKELAAQRLGALSVQQQSVLPTLLEHRIRSMAYRWRYTDIELAEVLTLAAADPHGWTLAVALDERRTAEFQAAGLLLADG